MTRDECFALVSSIDPSAKRLPPGLFEMANAIEARVREEVKRDIAAAPAPAACDVPPAGWACTREHGHEGPCAAVPTGTDTEIWQRGYEAGIESAKPHIIRDMMKRISAWWRS